MSSNLCSLDSLSKLRRDAVMRSFQYEKHRNSLEVKNLQQLCQMEALLFQSSPSVIEPDDIDDLTHSSLVFRCSIGAIFLYHNDDKSKYVLLDFSISPDGGGDFAALPNDVKLSTGWGWAQGMVACIQFAFIQFIATATTSASVTKFFRHLHQNRPTPQLDGQLAISKVQSSFSYPNFSSLLARLTDEDADDSERLSVLPDWSLLRRSVRVPEQLMNDYARSIVAGEFSTRMIEFTTSNVAENHNDNYYYYLGISNLHSFDEFKECQRRLYNDSKKIVESISNGDKSNDKCNSSIIRFGALTQGGCVEDDRCLNLLKCELNLAFACYLRHEYSIFIELKIGKNQDPDPVCAARLLRKFSLFSNFIWLSNKYFGEGPKEFEADHEIYGTTSSSFDSFESANRYAEQVFGYGKSIHKLNSDLSNIEKDAFGSTPNFDEMRHRLIGLASEILEQ